MLLTMKAVTLRGRTYKASEAVDAADLPAGKAEQLIAQRVLRDDETAMPKKCVVLRDVTIKGKEFKRGDKVGVGRLDPGKLAQLLDHRILGLTT